MAINKKFLPNYEQSKQELVVYDKSVLDLFKPLAHVSWIDDGISKQAMVKFNIGWYARNEQITLPVFDVNGDLVGIHARNTRRQLVDKGLKYQPLKTLMVNINSLLVKCYMDYIRIKTL